MNKGEWKMSYGDISRLTLAQLRNVQHEGRPPIPGAKVFSSTKEARAARGQSDVQAR